MHYDFLIVGAGLYGSVFAHEMRLKGKTCLVIDERDHVGGNIYTQEMSGIKVHKYGAHIFHTSNERVWRYVNRFATFDSFINSPMAIYEDEIYNLPFNMNTFAKLWGVKTPQEAKAIIARQCKEAKKEIVKKHVRAGQTFIGNEQDYDIVPANLEEYALLNAGTDIYEKLIRGYTMKQWGRPCDELPANILKRIPLRFVYDNNYFNDIYQGIPREGYTVLIENLLEGVEVKLGISYKDFILANGSQKSAFGKKITFGKILYTGTIDEYFDYCYGALEYRSLRFETEYLEEVNDYQGNAVINYTSYDVPYTRIIEHKHFDREVKAQELKGTVITKEYPVKWSRSNGAADCTGQNTDNHGTNPIRMPGVYTEMPDSSMTQINIPYSSLEETSDPTVSTIDNITTSSEPYYPINDKKNSTLYGEYLKLASENTNVIFGGRLGLYRYLDMDKTIELSLNLAAIF